MGQLPDYIPLLATIDRNKFAVQIQRLDGQTYSMGDLKHSFPLMSVVKPFTLLFLLEQFGHEKVFQHVGMAPSDQPFYSLAQLTIDRGFPRNPMINSGAIVLASLLPGPDGATRCETMRQWLNAQAGSKLVLDEAMLTSVRSLPNEVNQTLANTLARAGQLNEIDVTIDTYNHICCLAGNVVDLVRLGLLLAKPQRWLAPSHQQTVNTLMLTCGLYEASAESAVRIGLPIKSGVSGALLAVVPGQGAIACYSPALDPAGNSIVSLSLLEQLSQELNLSVFSSLT